MDPALIEMSHILENQILIPIYIWYLTYNICTKFTTNNQYNFNNIKGIGFVSPTSKPADEMVNGQDHPGKNSVCSEM